MTSVQALRPGDIGFCNINGGAGVLVWLGQKLLAATSWDERKLRHVFIVTEVDYANSILRIVQAMPGGAEEKWVGADHVTADFVYLRPAYALGQEAEAVNAAKGYVGTPYSFLDYVALVGLHLGVDNGPVRRYVRSTGHMICSQLVDQALADACVHVFSDGRWPGDVMPVVLYRGLTALPGTSVIV